MGQANHSGQLTSIACLGGVHPSPCPRCISSTRLCLGRQPPDMNKTKGGNSEINRHEGILQCFLGSNDEDVPLERIAFIHKTCGEAFHWLLVQICGTRCAPVYRTLQDTRNRGRREDEGKSTIRGQLTSDQDYRGSDSSAFCSTS